VKLYPALSDRTTVFYIVNLFARKNLKELPFFRSSFLLLLVNTSKIVRKMNFPIASRQAFRFVCLC